MFPDYRLTDITSFKPSTSLLEGSYYQISNCVQSSTSVDLTTLLHTRVLAVIRYTSMTGGVPVVILSADSVSQDSLN